MNVIPYATQWIEDDDLKVVETALKSSHLTQGKLVADFEVAVADYCGAKYAVAVSSGTSALHIACLAANLSQGDEAITSPITFAASANAMLYCQARPVFADVNQDTICLDPIEIKKQLTDRTKAILPVHFAGQPANMEEIHKLAKENNLIVIEDAAHALGATHKRSKIGCGKYSDMTILSFHAVKHITTGEGGMVLTNNSELANKLRMLRSHGITRDIDSDEAWYYEMQELGFNYRITDFQCALGQSQLAKLPCFLERRAEIVQKYNQAFADCPEIETLAQKEDSISANHLYVIKLKLDKLAASRKEIFDAYRSQGILVNVHYIPVYFQPYYRELGYERGLCPEAENYYKRAITLPLFPKMSEHDVARVIKATKTIIGDNRMV